MLYAESGGPAESNHGFFFHFMELCLGTVYVHVYIYMYAGLEDP